MIYILSNGQMAVLQLIKAVIKSPKMKSAL